MVLLQKQYHIQEYKHWCHIHLRDSLMICSSPFKASVFVFVKNNIWWEWHEFFIWLMLDITMPFSDNRKSLSDEICALTCFLQDLCTARSESWINPIPTPSAPHPHPYALYNYQSKTNWLSVPAISSFYIPALHPMRIMGTSSDTPRISGINTSWTFSNEDRLPTSKHKRMALAPWYHFRRMVQNCSCG